MASQGFEAVDLDKKKLIEETLGEKRDDSIIRVVKMRKRHPPKIRSKARNIASNSVHYYSRVYVKANAEVLNLSGCSSVNDAHELFKAHKPHNINVVSKVVTECLAERKELMDVHHQYLSSLIESDSNCKLRKKCFTPHMCNTDFIVDQKFI